MKVEEARKESRRVDFKESFDFNSSRDKCEIIKDIVAMANSGGGYILIGIKDDGTLSGFDVTSIIDLDPAKITDQIAKYTSEHFCDFEVYEAYRNGQKIAVLAIKGNPIPMIFTSPGNYDIGGGKQKAAFSAGTIYFRHGAKSEPGNSKDLKDSIEKELLRTRKTWLSGIRKVVEAPVNSQVQIITPSVKTSQQPDATPIRFTDDPNAPAYYNIDPNKTHPYRQKEILDILNQKIKERSITQYDLLCIRQIYQIEDKPEYYYKPKYGSPQYSDLFVNWVMNMYKANSYLFDEAKAECRSKARKAKSKDIELAYFSL